MLDVGVRVVAAQANSKTAEVEKIFELSKLFLVYVIYMLFNAIMIAVQD